MKLADVQLMSVKDWASGVSEAVLQSLTVRDMQVVVIAGHKSTVVVLHF